MQVPMNFNDFSMTFNEFAMDFNEFQWLPMIFHDLGLDFGSFWAPFWKFLVTIWVPCAQPFGEAFCLIRSGSGWAREVTQSVKKYFYNICIKYFSYIHIYIYEETSTSIGPAECAKRSAAHLGTAC